MELSDHVRDNESQHYYPEVIVVFLFILFFGCASGVVITLVIQLVAKVLYA